MVQDGVLGCVIMICLMAVLAVWMLSATSCQEGWMCCSTLRGQLHAPHEC